MDRFVFPRWINKLILVLPILVVFGGLYTVVLVMYAASPKTTDVGYAPKQPVPYSHALHAGRLPLAPGEDFALRAQPGKLGSGQDEAVRYSDGIGRRGSRIASHQL